MRESAQSAQSGPKGCQQCPSPILSGLRLGLRLAACALACAQAGTPRKVSPLLMSTANLLLPDRSLISEITRTCVPGESACHCRAPNARRCECCRSMFAAACSAPRRTTPRSEALCRSYLLHASKKQSEAKDAGGETLGTPVSCMYPGNRILKVRNF